MKVVIIGSTGLTGSFLLQELLQDHSIHKVLSISRKTTGMTHPKLEEILVNSLTELPKYTDALAADVYFCCLGTTIKKAGSQQKFREVDHDAVISFAQIARHHKARSLAVISAMGANPKSTFFYNRVKGEMEAQLQDLGLNSVLVFRPALLHGPRAEQRPGEKMAESVLVPLSKVLPTKMRRSLITPVSALAKKMHREALRAPAGFHILKASEI